MSSWFWLTVGWLFARDRSPARRKPTRKRWLLRAVGIALLGCGLYAVYAVPRTEGLHVQVVQVSGTEQLTPREIVERSGLIGRSIFAVRGGDVAARLEALPYVASARVDAGLSSTVRVHIVERVPKLVWRSAAGMYLVDDAGVVLEEVARRPRLPLLEVEGNEKPSTGSRLDAEQVAFVLALYGELSDDLRPIVEKMTYSRALGYRLESGAGWKAALGDADQVGVKAEVLRQVLVSHGESAAKMGRSAKQRPIAWVDVSAPATPYYRLQPSAVKKVVKPPAVKKPMKKPPAKPRRTRD